MKAEGNQGAHARRFAGMAVLATVLLCVGPTAFADSYDNGDFESFALGDPYGQDGWGANDLGGYNAANWDIDIVDPSAAWGTELGNRALRISNAVTSGGFGNQLLSASLVNEAGETGATASVNAGGTRQSRLSGVLTFASATKAHQPGLAFSFAADAGDGTRMANFRITDEAGGFRVEVSVLDESIPSFVAHTIASGLSHSEVHTLRFSLDLVDGDNNDVLWVKVDESGCSTFAQSGSWEQYHRYYAGNATPITFTADSLLFRVSGAAVPANAGNGLLFDRFDLATSTVPAMPAPGVPATPVSPVVSVNGHDAGVSTGEVATNGCQPVTEYRATLTPQGGGSAVILTSPTPQFEFADLADGTYAVTVAAVNAAGSSSECAPAAVVIAADAGSGDPTPTPSPTGGEDTGGTGSEGDGDGGELANSGPMLTPLALMAFALVLGGFAVRARAVVKDV